MSIGTDWKVTAAISLSFAILVLAACGGGGGGTTSGLSMRAFVSDDIDGSLHIEDAQHDVESSARISTGNLPRTMALSPDKSITLVFNSADKTLAVVVNASESVLGRITLPSDICAATPPMPCVSYVSMSDNTVGFVAVPNCPAGSCNGNLSAENAVDVVDLKTTFNVTSTIDRASDPAIPNSSVPLNAATTLVLSPTGNKLLVFGGPGEHVDTLVVIDTALAKTSPSTAATQISGFDRPVSAVFSSDGNTAYIVNCGPECGKAGVTASVAVLDLTGKSPTVVGTPFPLPAATVGLLSGTKLFVAGTPSGTPGALAGMLSVLDTSPALAVTSFVPISDGFHNHMELASSNKLFIGANTCSNGCLTVVDTSKTTAAVDLITGDVTGIAPINGRNVVYVVENVAAGSTDCLGQLPCLGKLRIYDTTASMPTLTPARIFVLGKAVDVKYVNQ